MPDGPGPVEQAEPPKSKGFFGRFRKSPPHTPTPSPTKEVPQNINNVRAELKSEATPQVHASIREATPMPKPEEERPPVVPEIKNNYGTESPYQATLNGKKDGRWQYAIRLPGNSDASYPRGHLLRTGASSTSDGTVLNFDSMDQALDFAMAKNREDSAKGWTDPGGEHHESDAIHYDPREKKEETSEY